MANLKSILSISIPLTILAALFVTIGSDLFTGLVMLAIIQGIFWKFVKWTF